MLLPPLFIDTICCPSTASYFLPINVDDGVSTDHVDVINTLPFLGDLEERESKIERKRKPSLSLSFSYLITCEKEREGSKKKLKRLAVAGKK